MFLRLIAAMAVLTVAGCGGVNTTVLNECRNNGAAIARYLVKAQNMGFVSHEGRWIANEYRWPQLKHRQKIDVAVSIYCGVAGSSGVATIGIYGSQSGELLASVVNGHFTD